MSPLLGSSPGLSVATMKSFCDLVSTMPRTCPAFAHAMAHSLCCAPLDPFTIQHAGSTTSPTIERDVTLAGSASVAAFADVPAVAGLAVAEVAGLAVPAG